MKKTIDLSNEALKKYNSWPHMERSHKASEAIIKYEDNSLEKG